MFDGFWYRCEVKHYSTFDEDGDYYGSYTKVEWSKYAVLRETPKGVWLAPVPNSFKDPDALRGQMRPFRDLVIGTAKKQLACPTKELALIDAIARKERHISGCRARLRAAENDLNHLILERHQFTRQSAKDAA